MSKCQKSGVAFPINLFFSVKYIFVCANSAAPCDQMREKEPENEKGGKTNNGPLRRAGEREEMIVSIFLFLFNRIRTYLGKRMSFIFIEVVEAISSVWQQQELCGMALVSVVLLTSSHFPPKPRRDWK